MLQWKPGKPSGPTAQVYYFTAKGNRGLWTVAKSTVRGVPQFVCWLAKERFPKDGPGYASSGEANRVANVEDGQ